VNGVRCGLGEKRRRNESHDFGIVFGRTGSEYRTHLISELLIRNKACTVWTRAFGWTIEIEIPENGTLYLIFQELFRGNQRMMLPEYHKLKDMLDDPEKILEFLTPKMVMNRISGGK
jgi:hypothetical protein